MIYSLDNSWKFFGVTSSKILYHLFFVYSSEKDIHLSLNCIHVQHLKMRNLFFLFLFFLRLYLFSLMNFILLNSLGHWLKSSFLFFFFVIINNVPIHWYICRQQVYCNNFSRNFRCIIDCFSHTNS